jgi:branched-subunit amino acid aminotransferase/4-amino-4-deoxychorismate lyase
MGRHRALDEDAGEAVGAGQGGRHLRFATRLGAGQSSAVQTDGDRVAVAESFLVDGGRVRGPDRHRERFARGCAEAGLDPSAPWDALVQALPATGRWFPRLQVRADGESSVDVRPAPPREAEVVARVFAGPDPRRFPRRKGPDLERLGALRAAAARDGAGEALLRDGAGRLLEGAYTSLLWWEDDALCAVPDDAPILDGVTRALLLALAADAGVPVRHRRPPPAELEGREVWLTSALHGIRAVVAGPDGTLPAGPAPRAAAWQARLEALAAPYAPT